METKNIIKNLGLTIEPKKKTRKILQSKNEKNPVQVNSSKIFVQKIEQGVLLPRTL